MWWVSRRIRAEREHCCDDLAVKTCGDAAAYARALATLEELRPAPAPFALAASGAPLLDRIRRLAGQPERSAVRPAWPVAGVIALLLLALLAVAVRNNPASAEPAAEGDRRDASHLTYAYDQSFFDYFGTNDAAAVETSRTNQIANQSALTNSIVAENNPSTQPPIAPFPLVTRATQTNQPSCTVEYNRSLGEQRALASKQSTIVTQLNPPSPAASIAGVDGPTIVVTVDKLGRYYYRNQLVSEGELKRDLEAEAKSSPQPMTLLLRVDEETESRVVVGMTELAKSKGISNVLFQTLPRGETTAKPPQINIKTKWVEIDAALLGTNTFMSFFATNESQSPATVPATFDFTEYYSLQPTNLAEPSSNVFLHSAHGDAPLAAFLTDTQFAATIKKLEQRDGVDILTSPEVTTESGRQCQIQAVDINTILIGGSPPGTTNGPRALTNILTGPIVDLVPRVSRGANKIDLKVIGTVTEFVGYENPATVTNQNGKPMPKNWAIPRFQVRQFSSTVTVTNAQTFVLGAAPVPLTTFQKSNDKVPVLGDIPLLGRLFRSTKTSTSTAQKSLVLLVTPTLVNPDGTRFVPPPEPKPDGQLKETGALEPRTNGFNRTNIVHTSKDRQVIMSKLDRIRLESVEYHTLPLSEVINNLTLNAKRLDPEKTGINFFLAPESPPSATAGTIDPATGLPVPALSTVPNVDLGNVSVTIAPALKNVRLMDVLDAITKCSDVPIKYAVLDYAVVFSLRSPEPVPLEIRTFHVDPSKFRELLENLSNLPRGAFAVTNLTNGFSYAASGHPDTLQVSVRKFFSSVGVDFDTNNPANVGKAFVWGDKKGVLTVRATAADLDMIHAALEALLKQPPQIKLKTVIAEVIQDDSRAFGFNWTLGNFNLSNSPGGGTQFGSNGAPRIGNPSGILPGTPILNSAGQIVTTTTTPSSPAPSGVLAGPSLSRNPLNAPTLGTISGILTDPQFRVARQALDQRDGATFFSCPEVIVESGRETRIQSTDPRTTNAPSTPVGINIAPALDIVPTASADERSLQLNVTAIVPEFLGYDNPGRFEDNGTNHPTVVSSTPLPHYRLRQVSSDVILIDGQTLVMGGFISQVPEKRAGNSKTNAPARRKHIVIFVTATLMNPDGTPYHSEEQRSALPAKPLPLLPAK